MTESLLLTECPVSSGIEAGTRIRIGDARTGYVTEFIPTTKSLTEVALNLGLRL